MKKVTELRPVPSTGDTPKREAPRNPWNGNLDEAELARPGGLLLAALIRTADERRQQLNDMARDLGVTYGYINQLRNGIRKVDQISDGFALSCAQYLCVPRMTVLMLAGRVKPEDLFEHTEMMVAEVDRAMSFLTTDPVWGPLLTPELRSAGVESRFALVRMYEEATGKVLMEKRLKPETLAAEVEKFKALMAQRSQQLQNPEAAAGGEG